MLVELLVFYEHASVFLKDLWETGKEWMRQQLGVSTNTPYLLLENNAVIPSTMAHSNYLPVAIYNPQTKRIATTKETDNVFKRLPWLSLQHVMGDHVVDLSDWMADVRTNVTVSLLTAIRLASYIHSVHLPEVNHACVRVITRDGEEKEYVYAGSVHLIQHVKELHRKQTCPFDVNESMEGMPIF